MFLCLIKRKNNLFFVVSEHAAVTIEGIQCRYCNFKATSSSLIQDHCSSVHKGKTVDQKKDQIVQQNTPKAEQNTEQVATDQLNLIQKGGRTSMRSCDVCQKVFQRNYALVLHLQSVHLRERRYQCSDCPKGFSSKKDLKRHTGKMLKKY